jgi:DNA polymerase
MAGDEALLADLSGDVYLSMARRLFNDATITKADPRRQIGKIVVLGAGYGLSWRKLEMFCKSQRVDLAASGISAEEAIKGFRTSYPAIPRLWYLFDHRAKLAITDGYFSTIGRCDISYVGGTLIIRLPSGRALNYRQARMELEVPAYAKFLGLDIPARPTIIYEGPRGRKTLYGGKIVENVDQAICSDLLRDALCRCEASGLRPVAHVHDEVINEVSTDRADKALEQTLSIMTSGPEWAVGFPLKAEGHVCQRYSK